MSRKYAYSDILRRIVGNGGDNGGGDEPVDKRVVELLKIRNFFNVRDVKNAIRLVQDEFNRVPTVKELEAGGWKVTPEVQRLLGAASARTPQFPAKQRETASMNRGTNTREISRAGNRAMNPQIVDYLRTRRALRGSTPEGVIRLVQDEFRRMPTAEELEAGGWKVTPEFQKKYLYGR